MANIRPRSLGDQLFSGTLTPAMVNWVNPVRAIKRPSVTFSSVRLLVKKSTNVFLDGYQSSLARSMLVAVFCFSCVLTPALAQEDAATQTSAVDEEGFEPLCNGKDLSGWVKEGKASFRVKDGMIVCDGSGNWPTWLRSEEVFENFILRLEYKTFWGGESGVFFHAPLHGRVSEVGFEVQIGGRHKNTPYATGAIFAAVAPLKPVQQTAMDEGYNTLEIVMNWPKLKVTLNGVVVQDLNCEKHELLRFKPRLGYIGFQDRGKPVHFRNVRIKRLPDQVRDQWKPMLKGNSLTRTSRNHTARSSTSRHSEEDLIGNGLKGWTVSKGCTAKWKIDDDGVLVSENGHGYLVSDQQYRNCEFQTYFQTTLRGRSIRSRRCRGLACPTCCADCCGRA